MRDSVLEAVLLSIANLEDSATFTTSYTAVARATNLLPEVLVEAIEELRLSGKLAIQENANGNPYGSLVLTPQARSWVNSVGEVPEEMINACFAGLRKSREERSPRRSVPE